MKTAPSVLLAATVLVASFAFGFKAPPAAGGSPYVAEVRIFAGNFAPAGWAFCDGQTLQINQNQALFSLLGTTYGGDGESNFRLPDLRGRVPMHVGGSAGPGLPVVNLGEKGGQRTVTLSTAEMPTHNHQLMANGGPGGGVMPINKAMASTTAGRIYGSATDVPMAADAIASTGGGFAHENTPPYQGLNYIIALFGIYPSEN